MDIQSRKIEFIQKFLKINNENALFRLEKLLHEEIQEDLSLVEPMTAKDFEKRIELSEEDFKNNKYKTSKKLLSKYKNEVWGNLV